MKSNRRYIPAVVAALMAAPNMTWALDCSPLTVWNSDDAYNSGAQVVYQEKAYEANWWTQNQDPATHSGDWQQWRLLGQCDGANQTPIVELTSPLNNSSFGENDSVVLKAQASDSDGSVSAVEFFINGVSLGVDSAAPFELNWQALAGEHTLLAQARDDQQGEGVSAEVQISVLPADGNAAPIVTLTAPTAQTQARSGEQMTLSANADDSDGVVTAVDFYVDQVQVGSDSSAPYSIQWQAESGLHQFQAKATDDVGAQSMSASVQVNVDAAAAGICQGTPSYVAGTSYSQGDTVENVNHAYRCDVAGWCSSSSAWAYEPGVGQHWQDAWTDLGICAIAPDITITSPSANATLLQGQSTVISADVSDSDGSVSAVEFSVAGNVIATDTSAPYQATWQVQGLGETAVTVAASDNEGNLSEQSVLVTVTDQPLVVSLNSPASAEQLRLGQSLTLAADASSALGSVTEVSFAVNGQIVGSDSSAPYTLNYTPASLGQYAVSALANDSQGNSAQSTAATINVIDTPAGKKHKLIGYWHNFVNPAGCPIPLSDISSAWDIIDIAFAENDRNATGKVVFHPFEEDIRSDCPPIDPVKFKQDIKDLQAQGKVVVLSLGGAEGTITLETDSDEANFVASLTNIINEWGFDGLDVDYESGSNLVHGSQIQARLGRALKQIEQNIGGDMYLTMAPEHPYVHGGMVAYSGIWGAYIPLIDDVRDTLDLLHVQLYNNGGLPNPYEPGSAPEGSVNMMVAHAKMLIEGFTLANGQQFAPLRDDQVAIGLPSGPQSANSGQAPTQNIIDALDCLTKGQACGTITPSNPYPHFGGVMTWSINWDKYDGYNFSGPIGDKLTQMNNGQ
ncbi:Ig-like domain-containing protein [Pseudoalteromonas sp. CNC9-20]|uniref:Ig-like domain-containing protein n=1 Tax=Pseudoalteromonas sp. CNC9-20 TaxID=2917750 RepID=UPI001EF5AD06|nr:Ig-like domain-containing protein [Pseudoalteromonas sp. CNC9-20]MCG7570841.1 Ig-like domain-containing protein [Pseudoalteromonas sp. CNC9-20]